MLMRAAQTLVAASLPGRHGLLPRAKADDATHRASLFLETRLDGEPAANKLEFDLLTYQTVVMAGSHQMTARMEELQKRAGGTKAAAPQRQGPLTVGELGESHGKLFSDCRSIWRKLKILGQGTPEDARSPPSAAEVAEAAHRYIEIVRVWVPLIAADGGAHERVVARLAGFWSAGMSFDWDGFSAAMWDAGVVQELGGLDEWRRGWQLYGACQCWQTPLIQSAHFSASEPQLWICHDAMFFLQSTSGGERPTRPNGSHSSL